MNGHFVFSIAVTNTGTKKKQRIMVTGLFGDVLMALFRAHVVKLGFLPYPT